MEIGTQALFHVALALLRVSTGGLMLMHGIGKLADWVNGRADFFDPFGIGGRASLALCVSAEFFCSILIIAGWRTRLAAIPLVITMAVAFFLYHANDELIDKDLPLLYMMNFVVIMLLGPGRYSVDRK